MKTSQAIGAWAGMIRGGLYVLLLYILIVAWPGLAQHGLPNQLTDVTNAFYDTPLAVVVSLIVLFDGFSSVLVALGLRDMLPAGSPSRMRCALAAATIAGALFAGYAMIAIAGRQQAGVQSDRVLGVVLQGVLDGAVLAFSVSVLLWASAGRDTKGFPRPLSYLMLAGGALGLLQILIAPLLLVSIVVNVFWSLWLGYKMLGDSAPPLV
jgi:hypothetical protein